MKVDFWVDPACPFCWTTARWIVDEVQTERDLDITWRPISLFFKNEPSEESPLHEVTAFSLGLLRVMESVRASDGNAGVFRLYWEFGSRIHHDKQRTFDVTDAIDTVGLDASHAAAFADETWDAVVREGMDAGLALTGNDVGTPLIAIENAAGTPTGYFGPVITRVPDSDKSVAMWDALVAMMDVDSFFELKRTRTETPDLGARPAPR